jgi:hypothetical protein
MLGPNAEERMHCRIVATVTAVTLLTKTAISADAHPAGGRLSCELVAGHHGRHLAFVAAAQDGDQWWWLRWDGQSGQATELVQIDPCDAKLSQGRYADDCMLPHGHPGPHSFDLPAAPPLTGDRHPVGGRPHTP